MLNFPKSSMEGVVVLDVSRVLAGPFAGQILGDHGAEVIKVESFDGDDTRGYGPPFVNDDAPYYLGLNRNKKDLALNLSSKDGIDVLWSMLESVDVLIENFKMSTWRKWGVTDLSQLTEKFPRLIHCRISGFGETGEFANLPGYDAALQAMSGLLAINGEPDSGGTRIGIPLVDTSTGMYAAMGILFALFEREKSDKGQSLEVTLFDTALAMLHPHTSNVLNGGKSARTGNGHPNIVPYDLFSTKTTQLFIAIGNDRQFVTLCQVLGNPELGHADSYKTNKDRVVNREALKTELTRLLSAFDGKELFKELMALGVPCAPVLSVEDALQLEHTRTREMHVELGEYRGTGIPIKLKRTPGAIRLAPPGIGQHSHEILQRFGIAPERIASLFSNNIAK